MATPFTINIDQSVLDDLKRRLQNTRFPDHIPGSGWDYGTEPSCLQARAYRMQYSPVALGEVADALYCVTLNFAYKAEPSPKNCICAAGVNPALDYQVWLACCRSQLE